jgi:ABC-type branched-subunit amino acid transport system permease subunit
LAIAWVRVIGYYFAVTILVLVMIVHLLIIYFPDFSGGCPGLTINSLGTKPLFFQFRDKGYFYFIVLDFILPPVFTWKKIGQTKTQRAMVAIENVEAAAASIGIRVVKNIRR